MSTAWIFFRNPYSAVKDFDHLGSSVTLTHWRPYRPKPAVQDYTALKHCNFLYRANIALTVRWALSRKSFKLQYPNAINSKESALFAKYYLLNLHNNKNDRFWGHRKRQKSRFLPSGFLQKSSLQNQKSTFTVKFNPYSSLEVAFFVLIRFSGPNYSFLL